MLGVAAIRPRAHRVKGSACASCSLRAPRSCACGALLCVYCPLAAVLYHLHVGKPVDTIPTTGFNVETVKRDKLTLNIWDVGGQDNLRHFWRHYYTGTQGVIFVVDSSDRGRIETAAGELRAMVADDQLADAVVLVLANKQDLRGAMGAEEVAKIMDVAEICGSRPFSVMPCVGTTGEGLTEGIEFLCKNMKKL